MNCVYKEKVIWETDDDEQIEMYKDQTAVFGITNNAYMGYLKVEEIFKDIVRPQDKIELFICVNHMQDGTL